jgi:rod shape-determining protein MreC
MLKPNTSRKRSTRRQEKGLRGLIRSGLTSGKILLGLLFAAAVVGFFASGMAKYIFLRITKPFAVFTHAVESWFGDSLDELDAEAAAEFERLQQQVDTLQNQVREAEIAIRENRELRSLMALPEPVDWQRITAPVIARDPVSWDQRFRIGKGSLHGIEVGQLVINADGAVGRVVSVSGTTAAVATVVNHNCKLSVRIVASDVVGIYRGLPGGGSVQRIAGGQITYLPRDTVYEEGQKVVTSGLTRNVPGGIPVGKIGLSHQEQKVREIVNGIYAKVWVKVPQEKRDFRFVGVLMRADDSD